MTKVNENIKIQCKAKSKRTGKQCGRFCGPEKTVCKWHGGNSKGAPKGNKRRVTHGAHEAISLSTMTQEEVDYALSVNLDPLETLNKELQILKVRESRILVRIKRAMDAETEAGSKDKDGKVKPRLMVVGGSQSATEYKDGSKTKGTSTDSESFAVHILKLENALTGVQNQISKVTLDRSRLLEVKAASGDDANGMGHGAYSGIPGHLIGPSFGQFVHDVRNNEATHFWLKGGRGSLKSTTVSLAFIDKLVDNPNIHAVVLRDVFATLKDSAYSQLIWAIDQLGLADFFSAKVSPLQITYNPTGQTIFFRGLDDPLKLKSIKPKFGYVGLIWFEEVAEIDGMDTIRSVLQSLMRGGEVFSCFYSYNPPKSKNNWVNVAVDEEALRPDTKVYHSDYTTVPRKWLGEPFLLQAEVLKEANLKAYEHEYLGIATGSGGDVFDNVVIEKILDEDIASLGAIRNGVDFGFAVDPFVFGRCGYNRLYDTLYIFDEFYQTKVHDDVAAKKIKERGVTTEPVFCDSADPKGIDNLKREGVNALGSTKFPGSREYGYKFLQRWARIVIDQARCPNAKREFTACEYERDKDGNFLSVIPKRNDHTIDKVRYALDREIANTRPTTYSTASSR